MKKIWTFKIGDPLPIGNNRNVGFRTELFCEKAVAMGHRVTWWTSTFSHQEKRHYFEKDTDYTIKKNYQLKILKSTGYKRNISIRRMIDHIWVALKIRKAMHLSKEVPDVMVASFPTFYIAWFAMRYAKKNKIPFYIDYRDHWPEVFYMNLTKFLQFFAKIMLSPFYFFNKRLMKNATGIISISDSFLELALQKASRIKRDTDFVCPVSKKMDVEKVTKKDGIFRVLFMGSLGYYYNFEIILRAFHNLRSKKIRNVELLIAGDGDKMQKIKTLKKYNEQIKILGHLRKKDLNHYMSISDVSICPYIRRFDSLHSFYSKSIQAYSVGLPILNSLPEGLTGKTIEKYPFLGMSYDVDDANDLVEKILYMRENYHIFEPAKIKAFWNKHFNTDVIYKNYVEHILKEI